MKKFFLAVTILSLGIFGVSCNNDDDNSIKKPIKPSSLKYSDSFMIDFYSEGKSSKPTIDWGDGKPGTFKIFTESKGLSIDKNTGVVSWNKNFEIKDYYNVIIMAENSLGSTTSTVTGSITNSFTPIFKKDFKGGQNTDPASTKIDKNDMNVTIKNGLFAKGILVGTASVTDGEDIVEGSYKYDTNKDKGNKMIYSYKIGSVEYELTLELISSVETKPYLKGFKRIKGKVTKIGYVKLDYQL